MTRWILALTIALGMVAVTPLAHAEHFDDRGWTLLGETTVDSRRDTDVIDVGRKEGRFTKLTLVVLDDDLEMLGMTVEFGNGETFSPEVRHEFAEGTRSRAIDLPGDARTIRTVTLTYGGFGRKITVRDHRKGSRQTRARFEKARVQVWAKQADEGNHGGGQGDGHGHGGGWNPSGWVTLGSNAVADEDGSTTFRVRRGKAYDWLTLAVTDGDVRITSVTVTFKRGRKATLRPDYQFRDGSRHLTFEVPSRGRTIKSIQVQYADRRGGRRDGSTIELYGRIGRPDVDDRVDTTGWTMLGEQTVEGRRDYDVFTVGRDEGRFQKLMIVVLDDEIEVTSMLIRTRRDELTPELRHIFRAGQRSRQIDLGDRARVIREVELVYGNTRPRSRARVQIWAR